MKCRTDDTLNYVQFLARRIDKQDIPAFILLILFDLGIALDNEGFFYLRRAIELQYAKTDPAYAMGIYHTLSHSFDSGDSWESVAQAIRRVIKTAWAMRDPEIWDLFFPPRRGVKPKCPSNKEFIATISCIIELWQSCKEVAYEKAV